VAARITSREPALEMQEQGKSLLRYFPQLDKCQSGHLPVRTAEGGSRPYLCLLEIEPTLTFPQPLRDVDLEARRPNGHILFNDKSWLES
jgi:hypothetical protein